MKKNGATVWWYERDTGALGSHHFSTLPNNSSYESEVRIKYARDAVRIVTVYDTGVGQDSFILLRSEALSYQQSLKDDS